MKIANKLALIPSLLVGMYSSTIFANDLALQFGTQPVARAIPTNTSQVLTYTIYNHSNESIHLNSIDVGPHDNPIYWDASNDCQSVIAASAACHIQLTLHAPASTGFINTALVVNYGEANTVLRSQPLQFEVYAAPVKLSSVNVNKSHSAEMVVPLPPQVNTASGKAAISTALPSSAPAFTPYTGAQPTTKMLGAQITVYAGMSYISTSKSNIVINQYETDKLVGGNNSTSFIPGLGVSYNIIHNSNDSFVQGVGVGVDFFNDNFNRTGQVYQYGLSAFNNYSYNMNLNSARLMLNGEVDFHPVWHMTFFAEGGIGGAYNYIKYSEKAMPGISGGELNMSSTYTTNFAYDIGAGVKIPLSNKLELSFRYLFTDPGSIKTGKTAENLVTLQKPIIVDMKSNSWLFGLSYLIQ